tara:strand:- start:4094 stop:4480 length:387 start_codon:yes stop_codon:yes gene_type:complete
MEDEIKKKKYYIYENIDKIKNHDQVIDIINIKNCKFTSNNNGIFLNLSVLSDELINLIYQIVINSLDYEENQLNEYNESELIDTNNENDENVEEKVVKYDLEKKYKLLLKDFNNEEQKIIDMSKKYNL